MAENRVELLPTASVHSQTRRGAYHETTQSLETHVVLATQNLSRMSGAIVALIEAGYLVTAYASPTRLLPRLNRSSSHPVALLVIDGGLTPAFARAAAIGARSLYTDLPILLLAPSHAARRTEFMPAGVSVLRLPFSETSLLAAAARLVQRSRRLVDEPPDAA
jgi:hypothetical protein